MELQHKEERQLRRATAPPPQQLLWLSHRLSSGNRQCLHSVMDSMHALRRSRRVLVQLPRQLPMSRLAPPFVQQLLLQRSQQVLLLLLLRL